MVYSDTNCRLRFILKMSYKTQNGDRILLELEEETPTDEVLPEQIGLDIRYEDDNYIIINKLQHI